MDFESLREQVDSLQEQMVKQMQDSQVDTRYEKNKLYDYLGKELVERFKKYKVIVAGGLITSLFTGSEINDVDVYFKNEDSLAGFIGESYGSFIIYHTKKATMFAEKNERHGDVKVQAIHFKYFETPKDVFDTFDFTAVMGAFDFETEEFYFDRNFLKHNSQKILKFNKGTAFPLMSLVRASGKYQDKGYSISRTEMMRIAMTCMNLDINSYDELKEQLGGLYGENMDKLFKDVEDEEFSLDHAIDKLQELSVSEEYFDVPETISFEDEDDLIMSVLGYDFKYFNHNSTFYRVRYNGTAYVYSGRLPDDAVEIGASEFFQDKKFYKFVEKVGDEYRSFFEGSFKYELGETVSTGNLKGLFFNTFDEIDRSTHRHEEDGVLIEASVSYEDFIAMEAGHFRFRKCKVLREVPREEWEDKVTPGLIPF